MFVMTENLRRAAGDLVRTALRRFTHSPVSGAVTGALTTALLQSSSATTVAAVGFVGAGLLSFPEALGIIFGANIGTTVTGWIVALIGFKLKLAAIAPPVVFLGVVIRVIGRGRIASAGLAIAGFGLIFVGIGEMQTGMAGFDQLSALDRFGSDTILARLALVALGIIATVITQSSSAGVAATLTALHAGAITFEQAAALVIGMDVGTTVTALLASIGGSLGARRTGVSHTVYNLLTATGAFFLLTPYAAMVASLTDGDLSGNGEVALVGFHTLFNLLGVVVVLPFTTRFAHMIEWMVPDRSAFSDDVLDRRLLREPESALNSVHRAMTNYYVALLNHVNKMLSDKGEFADLTLLDGALTQVSDYLNDIEIEKGSTADVARMVSLMHALDHVQRLHERCEEDADRGELARRMPLVTDLRKRFVDDNFQIENAIQEKRYADARNVSGACAESVNEALHDLREHIVRESVTGEIEAVSGGKRLDALRWMHRVADHIASIARHLDDSAIPVLPKDGATDSPDTA